MFFAVVFALGFVLTFAHPEGSVCRAADFDRCHLSFRDCVVGEPGTHVGSRFLAPPAAHSSPFPKKKSFAAHVQCGCLLTYGYCLDEARCLDAQTRAVLKNDCETLACPSADCTWASNAAAPPRSLALATFVAVMLVAVG